MRCLVLAVAVLVTALAGARPLDAQTDVIRGRVTAAATDSPPIENASVTATSMSGNVNRSARTDRNGRYTITFPGGEGDYVVTFVAMGYAPRRLEVKRTADEGILIADVRLTQNGATLDTVVTVGRRNRVLRGDALPDVSGTERPVNNDLVSIDQLGNLAAMAASLPGVLFIQGTNGDPSGFSALGLDAAQNIMTLNGMTGVSADLPRDAEYIVTVATSPYDVTQGQFSGARQNVALGSGSNYVSRRSSLVFNAPQLQWTDPAGRALGQRYMNANLGGLLSGPISYDKAFYDMSYSLGRRANDLHTLLDTDPIGLQAYGVVADSVNRLLGILQNARVPATVRGFPNDQLSDQGVILGTFDVAPPSSSSGQAVNLTVNGSWNKASPGSPLTVALPSSGLNTTRWTGIVQGHHSGYFGVGILSETGVALNETRRYNTPYLELPDGSVLVTSHVFRWHVRRAIDWLRRDREHRPRSWVSRSADSHRATCARRSSRLYAAVRTRRAARRRRRQSLDSHHDDGEGATGL